MTDNDNASQAETVTLPNADDVARCLLNHDIRAIVEATGMVDICLTVYMNGDWNVSFDDSATEGENLIFAFAFALMTRGKHEVDIADKLARRIAQRIAYNAR